LKQKSLNIIKHHQTMQPVFDIQDDPAPVEVLIPILWLMHEGREKKTWKKMEK